MSRELNRSHRWVVIKDGEPHFHRHLWAAKVAWFFVLTGNAEILKIEDYLARRRRLNRLWEERLLVEKGGVWHHHSVRSGEQHVELSAGAAPEQISRTLGSATAERLNEPPVLWGSGEVKK